MILDTCNGFIPLQAISIIKYVLLFLLTIVPSVFVVVEIIRFSKFILNNEVDTKELVRHFLERFFICAAIFFIIFYGMKMVFSDETIEKLKNKGLIQNESCELLSKVIIKAISNDDNTITLSISGNLEYSYFTYNGKKYNVNEITISVDTNNVYKITFYDKNGKKIVEKEFEYKYVNPNDYKDVYEDPPSGETVTPGSSVYYPRQRDVSYIVPNYDSSMVTSVNNFDPSLVGKAIADLAYEVGTYNKEDFIYSGYVKGADGKAVFKGHNSESYAGTRFSGVRVYGTTGYQIYDASGSEGTTNWGGKRFIFDCVGYQYFIAHYATKLGGSTYYSFNPGSLGFTSSSVSNLAPGDLITYSGHYLIYIGNINGKDMIGEIMNASTSNFPNNWTVRVAELNKGKIIGIKHFSKMVDGINYNKVVSEPTLWAKLDIVKPEIVSLSYDKNNKSIKVTSYDKTWDKFIDTSGNGINGYTITKTLDEPVNWTNISYDSTIKEKKDTTFEIKNVSSGTYYVWVRDRGGNVNYKQIVIN